MSGIASENILFVILLIASYLLGNISPSTLLARARGLDIKKEGSGNAGTTNALRVLGKKAALITLVVDIGKGFLPVFIALRLLPPEKAAFCALAVFLGHVWPVLLKFQGGLELGKHHKLFAMVAPMFAAVDDGLGGDDGHFKGLLSQVRYDFPILTADKSKGERFEVFGHVFAELFNPGDYFETDKPAWFVRWQIDFQF